MDTTLFTAAAVACCAVVYRRALVQTKTSETDPDGADFEPERPWWVEAAQTWVATGKLSEFYSQDLLVVPAVATLLAQPVPDFGMNIRRKWFKVDPKLAYLNHGAFGGTLVVANQAREFYTELQDRNPVKFMNELALPHYLETVTQLAKFVGSRPQDIALVPNATTGTNAVVKSFPFKKGDVALTFSVSYEAVHNVLHYTCTRAGARMVRIPITFPLTGDGVLAQLEKALDNHPTAALAIVDHIVSCPAAILPVKKFVAACHKRGVKVLIDGAHAVGQLPLNLAELDADYYTSNMHKWLCTPKGTAFLWVHQRNHAAVQATVTSHGYLLGFAAQYFWPGTADISNYLACRASIQAIRRLGPGRMREYCHSLVLWAADMLAERWGTAVLTPASQVGNMSNVRIPHGKYGGCDAAVLTKKLREEHGVEVNVYSYQGQLHCRLSAQVYNYREEYERLARGVIAIQGL